MAEAWALCLSFLVAALGTACLQRIAMRRAHAGSAVNPALRLPPSSGASAPFFRLAALQLRAGDIIAAVAGITANALFLLLTARPGLSGLLCLALGVLLLIVNRAKEQVLHEPLVLADAWLLPQVFQYPHLYFPFLPIKKLSAWLLLAVLCLVLFFLLEAPQTALRALPAQSALSAVFLLPIACLALLRGGFFPYLGAFLLRLCPLSPFPEADARRNGPLAAALLHPVWAGSAPYTGRAFFPNPHQRPGLSHWPENFESMLRRLDALHEHSPALLPHVVIVQAESFQDIRPLLPEAQRRPLAGFLPHWDALCLRGRTLPTPETAFGAYTMRTEFSVLTGLPATSLGPWAFNPYILAARRPFWSLARYFAGKGYNTLCMHPYHKHFFQRDKVIPNLGFRHFWGLEELEHLERFGPYISDLALGKELQAFLHQSPNPAFCFVVTMEAHGPWLADRLPESLVARELGTADHPAFSKELRTYLCHLKHMDGLFGMLLALENDSEANGRSALLWAYGDHAPGLAITGSAMRHD